MRDSIPDLTDAAIEIPDEPRPEPPKPPPPPPARKRRVSGYAPALERERVSEVDFDHVLSSYPPPMRIEPAAATPRWRWRRSA